MSDVFYLRPVDPPITPDDVQGMVEFAGDCFSMHRVDWTQSFLATDGGRMLCWYRAPDAESARLALRQLGSDLNAVWAGTPMGDDAGPVPTSERNIVAELSLATPPSEQEIQELTAAGRAALEQSGATLLRTFVSTDRQHLVCLLDADDTDSVRTALAAADLSADRIWPCTAIEPRTA